MSTNQTESTDRRPAPDGRSPVAAGRALDEFLDTEDFEDPWFDPDDPYRADLIGSEMATRLDRERVAWKCARPLTWE